MLHPLVLPQLCSALLQGLGTPAVLNSQQGFAFGANRDHSASRGTMKCQLVMFELL